jgi:GTP-binding protein
VISATEPEGFPEPRGLEVIMMGRSNCGKSSLINRWLGRKALARTSSTPGRTRLLNFFQVTWRPGSEPMTVVDLPGYGYAAAPKAMVMSWRDMIGQYLLASRPNRLAFLLMDIRRKCQNEEKDLVAWLKSLNIPYQLVATKADKISFSQSQVALKAIGATLGGLTKPIAFSALNGRGREELITLTLEQQRLISSPPQTSSLAPAASPSSSVSLIPPAPAPSASEPTIPTERHESKNNPREE